MNVYIRRALRPQSRYVRFQSAYVGSDHPYVIKSPAPDLVMPSPMPNFNDFLTAKFSERGDKTAIIVRNPDGSVDERTFKGLLEDVDSVASELKTQLGFGPGSTTLLVSPNHADYFAAVHAVLKVGGVLSPANPLYTPFELANQLRDSGATVVLAHPMVLENALAAVKLVTSESKQEIKVLVLGSGQGSGSGVLAFDDLKGTGAVMPSLGPVGENQVAVLPYSSGTTGLPKGTRLSHKNLVANILQFEDGERGLWNWPNEVLISPLPFFHIYGFTASLNSVLFNGGTAVTMPAFDMVAFLTAIQELKCTRAHLVPPIILGLAKHPVVDKFDLSSLKTILSGAAPLGAEVEQAAAKRLNCVVKQAWGMSELAPLGTVNPEDDVRSGSSGIVVPSMLYKVVDTETGELLPRGEEGEIVCAGPNVMLGYLNNEEANKHAFDSDGWFRTGDIGKFDDDGFVTFTDRLKELIKYKGFQVPPAELEALLLTHDSVLDAAVIARQSEEAGEVPVAFVVVKPSADDASPGVTPEEVAAWVAERVAPHKKLRGGVILLDAIPKSASGKILRRVLVDRDRNGEFAK